MINIVLTSLIALSAISVLQAEEHKEDVWNCIDSHDNELIDLSTRAKNNLIIFDPQYKSCGKSKIQHTPKSYSYCASVNDHEPSQFALTSDAESIKKNSFDCIGLDKINFEQKKLA